MIELLETERDFGTSRLVSGKPDYYVFLTANRDGLLTLASTFLRAAMEPVAAADCRSKPISLPGGLKQVYENEKDLVLRVIQRMELWPGPETRIRERKRRAWVRDRVALLTCGTLACIIALIFVAGIVAISMLLIGN